MARSLALKTFLISIHWLSWPLVVPVTLGAVFGHMTEFLTLETSNTLTVTSISSISSLWSCNSFICTVFGKMTIFLTVITFDRSVTTSVISVTSFSFEVSVWSSVLSFPLLSGLRTFEFLVPGFVTIKTSLLLHL